MNTKGLELWCAHLVSVVERLTETVEKINARHPADVLTTRSIVRDLADVKIHLASLKSEVEAR